MNVGDVVTRYPPAGPVTPYRPRTAAGAARLGRACLAAGDLPGALAALERSLELQPDDAALQGQRDRIRLLPAAQK